MFVSRRGARFLLLVLAMCSMWVTTPLSATTPYTPSWMSMHPYYCYGEVWMSWAPSTGATYYEAEQSDYSDFIPSWIVYEGPGTYFFHDGGYGGIDGFNYYRVRACNANGCSDFRDGGAVYTYDPCL